MIRLIVSWALLLALSASAESIREYHTAITVHPSGSLHIDEAITYDFGSLQRHGIFRDIPLTVKVSPYAPKVPVGLAHFTVRLSGQPVPFQRSTIDSQTGGEMVRYRIGDPNKTVTGLHTYTLSYDVQRGVYPSSLSGMEAIRWNAVGAGSNVPTEHAVADLNLPPALSRDVVRIKVYTGTYGSTDSRADYRWIDDHHVRFEVRDLAPHEALTVEANYPEGLLGQRADALKASTMDQLLGRWHWGALVAFFLWLWNYAKRFGAEDRAGSIAPQYYPPKGLSLLESGLILDKFADKKDFSAAILELGTLGYLEVHQPDGDTNPIIRRTDKPTATDDTLTPDQLYLLNNVLFKNRDTYVVKTQDAARAERINRELDTLNEMLYTWSVSSGQMRTNPKQTRFRFLMTAGGIAVVLMILAVISSFRILGFDPVFSMIISSIFLGFGTFFLIRFLRQKTFAGVFIGLLMFVFTAFSFIGILASTSNLSALLSSPVILLLLLPVGIYYFYRKIGMFTPKGLETYRYLLGYRDFMQHVEKDRIRRFLKKDPGYLDRGLPYAVLFGLNKHWLSFYEALDVPQPAWYYGDLHHMNDFNRSVQSQTVPPPSESGGFSGGGSFSGGGGGGGGVGSW